MDVNGDSGTYTHIDGDNLKRLFERSTNMLTLINTIIYEASRETHDIKWVCVKKECDTATSYLDMSVRNYGNYELNNKSNTSNRNEYVDVIGKPVKDFDDDDNIYDNYIVERNDNGTTANEMVHDKCTENSTKKDTRGKHECPFNGLPAAHLTIMHSPKVGWLTMHLRGKRFTRHFGVHFKRKYYTGLVMKQLENDYCEWWLLMYAGGTSDLKPTVCLQLNQFEVCADAVKDVAGEKSEENANKRNPCKFELNEKIKETKKDPKSYCFVAETSEHCDHWVSLLKQLSIGLPYIEMTFLTTAQIRKLPMLPLNVKNVDCEHKMDNRDTVDRQIVTGMQFTSDLCNYSEGVYEEPEDYYKNVPVSAKKTPILPVKKVPQSPNATIQVDNILSIYDTPKKPIRKTHEDEHFEVVSTPKNRCTFIKSEDNGVKCDNDIRSKLTTQLKEQTQKYSFDQKSNDVEINGDTASTISESANSKYQLSSMRKWLFSNHFSKLRQSSNSTHFGGVPCDESITKDTSQAELNQNHEFNEVLPSTDTNKRTFSVQPKGNKVHQIINQLEANGQLTLLSGGTSTNKCIVSN